MLFSETSPASPNIYHAKFYTSIAIPLLYILITILSLTSSPSLLLTFESIGYFLLTSFATQILRQEYKNIGKNSIYLKVFWTEFALFQVITSLLVGLCDKKIYFPVYLVLDIVACFMAALMLIAKENVTEKLLEYESVWNKFDSVTSEPKKKKEKKVWNNINHISLPAFVIDEESTVYFRILVVKGKHGEDCEELQRMAIEFNSLYEDFKRTHTKARIPNFPPKVPQRLQLNEKILDEKRKMLQEILNYLLDRKFKKICDFLNPQLPFYGKATVAQEMTEEIVEIAEIIDIEEAKDDYEEDSQVDSEILTIDYTVEIVNTFEVGSIKKYTMYKIETKGQNKYFEASHRFQDFKKLHGELVKIIPTLGELPSSSLTKFSTSREVVNERKICLEKYLQGILQIQELQGYRPVVEFLNLHKSVS